jgi:hypothetical protein
MHTHAIALAYPSFHKKRGIGGFANHRFSPNCSVAKLTIGNRVWMGIFAKREMLRSMKNSRLTMKRVDHDGFVI